jgi:predicted nucleotidyltransferase
MTVARIEIPEAHIGELWRRYGIRKPALVGSVPSDCFTDSSDIDVQVEFRTQERVGFFRLAGIEEALSRLFGGRKIDLRTPMDLSRYSNDEVVRGALVVYAES